MYHSRTDNVYVLPAKVVHLGLLTLVFSLLFNLSETFIRFQSVHEGFVPTQNHTWTGAKTPNQLPINVRQVALEVVDSERYGMNATNDWASIFPLGLGFVKGGDDGEFYALSMYHQLHCMNSFRKMFQGHRNASKAEHDSMHVLHCLTYMRQMVLCNADTTLEPAFTALNTDGRKTKAAYGTGVTHQCRDWVQVRDYVEGNYENWREETKGFATTEINAIAG